MREVEIDPNLEFWMKKSSVNFVIFAYFEKHFPGTKKIEKK